MKTELRALEEIKPYEKNPGINDGAVEAVARSISEFGKMRSEINSMRLLSERKLGQRTLVACLMTSSVFSRQLP